jgi:hypothetical protein
MIDGLTATILGVRGYEYAVHQSPLTLDGRVMTFRISQEHVGEILCGEIYSPGSDTPESYVVRWPTAMNATACLSFATSLVKTNGAGSNPRSDNPGDSVTDPLPPEPILAIHTTSGVTRVPLKQVRSLQQSLPSHKSPEIIEILLGTDDQDTEADVQLLQLRVHTCYADFVFDMVPPENRSGRYCSVMSSYNVAAAIVAFGSRTAIQGVFHSKLTEVLRKQLSAFPASIWPSFARN